MNMSDTIIAKSDQINAVDLLGGSVTVTVKEVRITAVAQPVALHLEETAKVFRPCKGMRRLIVKLWGEDAKKYVGRAMTLYCDPDVTWAGKKEGGIRISHMTHIRQAELVPVRTSKEKTKVYQVEPLSHATTAEAQEVARPVDDERGKAETWIAAKVKGLTDATTVADVDTIVTQSKRGLLAVVDKYPDLHERFVAAERDARAAFDPFGLPVAQPEGRDDADMGEAHTDDDRITDAVIAENTNA